MKILIAPDSFKDSLSAKKAADIMEKAARKIFAEVEIIKLPMADGGEGTVKSLISATGGKIIETEVMDPLMRPVKSFYGILGDGKTAVIEMAAASGLELLKKEERNPLKTTSYGTGELIVNALENDCKEIIIGIGGSATTDGGIGMAAALGARFLDQDGNDIELNGEGLGNLHKIGIKELHPKLDEVKVKIASDVTNPLYGQDGAAHVYGPQKGADDKMVQQLDQHLKKLAEIIKSDLGREVHNIPGAGAAGGLGAGLIAFLDAEMKPGFDLIAELTNLEQHIKSSHLILAGEGKIDFQTQYGKTPFGIAKLGVKHNKTVLLFSGTLEPGYQEWLPGKVAAFSIINRPAELQDILNDSEYLLEDLVTNVLKVWASDH